MHRAQLVDCYTLGFETPNSSVDDPLAAVVTLHRRPGLDRVAADEPTTAGPAGVETKDLKNRRGHLLEDLRAAREGSCFALTEVVGLRYQRWSTYCEMTTHNGEKTVDDADRIGLIGLTAVGALSAKLPAQQSGVMRLTAPWKMLLNQIARSPFFISTATVSSCLGALS